MDVFSDSLEMPYVSDTSYALPRILTQVPCVSVIARASPKCRGNLVPSHLWQKMHFLLSVQRFSGAAVYDTSGNPPETHMQV